MAKKYEPYLFGVAHAIGFEKTIIRELLRLKPKSVGIEASHELLNHPHLAIGLTPFGIITIEAIPDNYWTRIKHALEEKGINVVPLVSDPLGRKLDKLGSIEINNATHAAIDTGKMSPKAELIFDTLTRDIGTNAQTKKPEIILTGAMHAAVLRKDLGIPKKKYAQFLTPDFRIRMRIWARRLLRPRFGVGFTTQLKRDTLKTVKIIRRFRRTKRK